MRPKKFLWRPPQQVPQISQHRGQTDYLRATKTPRNILNVMMGREVGHYRELEIPIGDLAALVTSSGPSQHLDPGKEE